MDKVEILFFISLIAREQKAPLLVSTQGQCGVRPRGGYRIVGGKESIPHSWPWQVSNKRTRHSALPDNISRISNI